MTENAILVAALYKFADLADFESIRPGLLAACRRNHVFGTILLAREGINGTIAGSRAGIDAVLAHVRSLPGCADLEHKESFADEMPFHRMKVRLKREIVTMGVKDIDPTQIVGTYVDARDWNALISDPDTVVIDTRNDYEVAIGTFEGAIDPHTRSFSEFPDWFRSKHNEFAGKKIAMFCTGGIRCEKATALMLELGFEEVYHLQGGILRYLQEMPDADNRWQGECFVFDTRVAVDRDLAEGGYVQCHACRRPLSAEDVESPDYREGVSCPHCVNEIDAERAARLEERRRQVALAQERGEKHIGQKLP